MKNFKKMIAMVLVIATMLMCVGSFASANSIAYGAATVKATSLNIRSGPGTSNSVIGSIPNGKIIVILERTNDGWYKINYNGTVGYVCTDYLINILTAENFNAGGKVDGDGVRMRSGPSTDYSILGTYYTGTAMNVIGINNGWYKVQYNGTTGYIRSDLFVITGSSASSSSSSTTTSLSIGEKIAQYALQFVGYNYVYGEESPSRGFDCSGLTYYVYGQFGYSISRTASQQYKNNGYSVSKSELQPGDLVFFSSDGYGVTHVGLYIGDGNFVHASTSTVGVIVSSLNSSYYTRVWWGAKRIAG
jgi:cell wall-associated NlpC family hydrolase